MSLNDLMGVSSGVGSGQVLDSLLNGQYRVLFQGRPTIAISQAGVLQVGAMVTMARTAAGLVIIAAGNASSAATVEVTING